MCLLLPLMSPLILLELVVPVFIAGAHGGDHSREEENSGYDGCTDDACLEDMVELVPADVGHCEVCCA